MQKIKLNGRNGNGSEIKEDRSPKIWQPEKIKIDLHIRDHIRWSDKQQEIINRCLDKKTKLCFVNGLWGSGKTALMVYVCLKLLNDRKIGDIYYLRNPAESSSVKVGYLKGDLSSKYEMYLAPFEEKLNEFLPQGEINLLMADERFIGLPIGFLRGRSFPNSALLVDEASCMTKEELLLAISRAGQYSKVFVIGDEFQSDIGNKSGFKHLYDMFNDEESKDHGIHCFELKEEQDIFRSDLLKYVMRKMKAIRDNVSILESKPRTMFEEV